VWEGGGWSGDEAIYGRYWLSGGSHKTAKAESFKVRYACRLQPDKLLNSRIS